MNNRDLVGLKKRTQESQERSTLRRLRQVHHHRGVSWFLMGFVGVVVSLGSLAVEIVQDEPNKVVVGVAVIVLILAALVVADWWERA